MAFTRKNGILHAEDIDLAALAGEVPTPFYCYSAGAIRKRYLDLESALAETGLDVLTAYAMKANSNQAVLSLLGGLGAGVDIVSGGEMQRALAAGIPARKMVFTGVGKTAGELEAALSAGVGLINLESVEEAKLLDTVAARLGMKARVGLRINPDLHRRTGVKLPTNRKIDTGHKQNKFGIDWDYLLESGLAAIQACENLEISGLNIHLGSQIRDMQPFEAIFKVIRDEMIPALRGRGVRLETLDIGGGLGVNYHEPDGAPLDAQAYAALIRQYFGDTGLKLVIEPGRYLVADAGVLLTRVIRVKREADDRPVFVILDAAMNDLGRPAIYGAYHHIEPVAGAGQGTGTWPRVDLCGPVCETADTFLQQDKVHEHYIVREFPAVRDGDCIAIRTAGAYGAVMASEYNSRPRAAEVMVSGQDWAVVGQAGSVHEMLAREHVPDFITSASDREEGCTS